MSKKTPQLGNLSPLYNFFLNPYSDARFTRCPQCEGKTGQKKVPLAIHVDPHYPIILNYTCRYCANCDLLIAHQDEIEGYLYQLFKERALDAIGHDYLVMGTTERNYWKEGVEQPHDPSGLLDNLHGFKQYLNFELVGGWMPNETAPKIRTSTELSSDIDNVKEAKKLVARMEADLPISVRAGKGLLKMLRKKGFPISDQQMLSIKHVFYGGDEMGIVCDVTPPGKHKEVVVCSLTHLVIIGNTPLADTMRAYQAKRERRLVAQGGFGLQDFIIKR
jgi:hypothetical protein